MNFQDGAEAAVLEYVCAHAPTHALMVRQGEIYPSPSHTPSQHEN